MKKTFIGCLVFGLLVCLALVVNAQKKDYPATTLAPVSPTFRTVQCPGTYDLAASITDVEAGNDATGPFLRVTGQVKNLGGKDFITSHSCQARLFVDVNDRAVGQKIAEINIPRLNRGASMDISGTYHYTWAPGFAWCQWGCVPLRGGLCRYMWPVLLINYSDTNEKNADCKSANNTSFDRPEHHVHFVVRCTE